MLETVDEVLAMLIADARTAGDDEADMVEMLARHAQLPPDEVRRVASMGYTEVSQRLHQIAGRKRRALRPL
jgi:hypothetical protein